MLKIPIFAAAAPWKCGFLPDLLIKTYGNSPTIPTFEQQNPYFALLFKNIEPYFFTEGHWSACPHGVFQCVYGCWGQSAFTSVASTSVLHHNQAPDFIEEVDIQYKWSFYMYSCCLLTGSVSIRHRCPRTLYTNLTFNLDLEFWGIRIAGQGQIYMTHQSNPFHFVMKLL